MRDLKYSLKTISRVRINQFVGKIVDIFGFFRCVLVFEKEGRLVNREDAKREIRIQSLIVF